MTPEEFESKLIIELEAVNLPVRAYPQQPDNYFPENDPGEVLVRYEGRKPAQRDISGAASRVTFFAEIVVVTRQLRGTGGAYDMLEDIRNALEGLTLLQTDGQLKMQVESFMDENNGLWQFGQKWEVTVTDMQTVNDSYYADNLGVE